MRRFTVDMADEIDLDAALAEFEEEIKDVPVVIEEALPVREPELSKSAGPSKETAAVTVAQAPPCKVAPEAYAFHVTDCALSPPSATAHVVAGPAQSVGPPRQPEWQRAMQERDALRMQASLDVQQQSGERQATTGKSAREFDAARKQTHAGAGIPLAHADPAKTALGAWVWDGWQWIWNPTAPGAMNGSQAAVCVEGTGGASNDHSVAQGSIEENAAGTKNVVRAAAGNVWKDPSLEIWPEGDFRIFVGDLAPDATEGELKEAFAKYESYNMSRVVVDKRTGEGKGYGFVSFAKGEDMVAALREMNGKYVGTRPVKLKKSDWQKRSLTSDRRKDMKVFKSTGLVAKRRRHK